MRVTGRVAGLLFGSGLCALVYQVAWLRELRLVFGASTAASAAVLAVFMGGLGAGGLWFGARVERARRPLRLYAALEAGIAVAAALTPLLIGAARAAYLGIGGSTTLGDVGGTAVRLLLSALVLAAPTFLMGGTLPAAAQAVESERDHGRRRLAVLYGANTLGAVAGALVSTFALLEVLGTRRMLWTACALNALVALGARRVAARLPEREPAEGPAVEPGLRGRFPLIAAAATGFAFLLMELVWYRMLGPLLGGSSFTFGLILAVALLGIGLGGVAYALFGRERPTVAGFALTCAAEAALIALPWALGDRVALWAAMLRNLGSVGFVGLVAGWAAICAVVVLPAAFVAGVQFPLLIALLGSGDRAVGRQVGLTYAWNTAGAIVGSLAGGFGLLPLLGAPGAWRMVVALLALLGVAALVVGRRVAWAPLALAAGALALLLPLGPTAFWRHSAIGVGRGESEGTPNSLRGWMNARRHAVVWEAEGVESSVAIDAESGYAFVLNGKIDGNARLDASTQVMAGLAGALVHPDEVRRALVVGLGTGSTAGWLGALPGVERVDVAELEPAIRHVAELCAPVNHDVLANPKVHVLLGDAREKLLTSRDRYDLIFSEPSNPYRAGIASLFTREFYEAARDRLQPHGLFTQWLQAYSIDAETVRSVYATLGAVFPHVDTWSTLEGDLLLVASTEPLAYDLDRIRARIGQEPFRSALAQVWRVRDVEGVFAHFVANDALARDIATVDTDRVNTDDLTPIEFGFARCVGRHDWPFHTMRLRRAARQRHQDRPRLLTGALDFARVDERKLSMMAAEEERVINELPYDYPQAARDRAAAAEAWVAGDLAGALAAWRRQTDPPDDPVWAALVAESLADAGDEAALPAAEALRAENPSFGVEADAITARLRLRQGRVAEAADLLERALTAYRTDPWPLPAIMARSVRLAPEIAARDRALGERLYHALAAPFAVHMLNAEREAVRLDLARRVDLPRLCVEAFAAWEPWPPWQPGALGERAGCYANAGDPRAADAEDDLRASLAAEPAQFTAGLPPP